MEGFKRYKTQNIQFLQRTTSQYVKLTYSMQLFILELTKEKRMKQIFKQHFLINETSSDFIQKNYSDTFLFENLSL